jgi:hypothetical protein
LEKQLEKSLFSVRRFGKSPTRAHSEENISINTHTRTHAHIEVSVREVENAISNECD